MKHPYLIILSMALCMQGYAQYRLEIGLKSGASNYLGDIGGNSGTRRDFIPDLQIAETRGSAGLFVRYRLRPAVSLVLSYNYGRIAGDDALSSNTARKARNLSFRNDIHELNAEAQYFYYSVNDLFHTYHFRNNFRLYVGTGVGVFHHNPQALYKGEWIDLRPLRTEGELHPYATWCMEVPFTTGFYFTFNNVYRLGWEIGWRKTFTDYLDDVSGHYAPATALPGPLSAALANRTHELNPDPAFAANFAPGSKRGDPSHNDAYIFTTVNFSYVIRGRSKQNARISWIRYSSRHRRARHFPVKF
ncbi:MAG: DUF6089 family protein [Bacteroidia bacterium]